MPATAMAALRAKPGKSRRSGLEAPARGDESVCWASGVTALRAVEFMVLVLGFALLQANLEF